MLSVAIGIIGVVVTVFCMVVAAGGAKELLKIMATMIAVWIIWSFFAGIVKDGMKYHPERVPVSPNEWKER